LEAGSFENGALVR